MSVAAALYNKDGRLFAPYPAKVPRDSLAAGPQPGGYRFEGGLVIGFQPVAEVGSQRLGPLYLASDLGVLSNALRLSAVIALAVMAGALLAAYLLAPALQGAISQPILMLAETAPTVSTPQDYRVRAPQRGGGELGPLAH